MKSLRSIRKSGAFPAALSLLLALVPAACNYGLRGGGGFPSHVRSLYIAPVENETVQFDLNQQIFDVLMEQVPRSLGLRFAGEESADAVLSGRIVRYDDAAQNYRPGAQGQVEVVQHQVQITMAIRIVDRTRNQILWEATNVAGRGEYRPDTQRDDVARAMAIESLIQQIVDGAQSQW